MIFVDLIFTHIEAARMIAKPLCASKPADRLARRTLSRINTNKLYVFVVLRDLMNMLNDIHESQCGVT